MKIVLAATNIPQSPAQRGETNDALRERRRDDEERSEEAIEASIVRLDGVTAEWLFRRAGE